jgi:hypothetical protein
MIKDGGEKKKQRTHSQELCKEETWDDRHGQS